MPQDTIFAKWPVADRQTALGITENICNRGASNYVGTYRSTLEKMLCTIVHSDRYRQRVEEENSVINRRVVQTCSSWTQQQPVPQLMERVLSWEKKIRSSPFKLLPDHAPVIERQTVVHGLEDNSYMFLSAASTRDIPFSDYYVINVVWKLKDVTQMAGSPLCSVHVYLHITWLKSTWFKSKLHSIFSAEWKKSIQTVQEMLEDEFSRVD